MIILRGETLVFQQPARRRNTHPPVRAVVITGTSSKHAALGAVKHGAYGFFEKPLDADELRHIVSQAARMRRLELENARMRDELLNSRGFSHLIGGSQSLEKIVKHAQAVAATSATVLITGENGTGKEMLARGDPRPNLELEPVLTDALQEYEWPGNVRELENFIERLVVLTSGPRLGLEFLPERMRRVLPDANAADENTLEGESRSSNDA